MLRQAFAPLAAAALVAVLAEDTRFETLYWLLTAERQEHLVGYMSYFDWNHTLFAPTDEAFDKLSAD